MKKWTLFLAILIFTLVLTIHAYASVLDDLLAKAKKEEKLVMLELGSAGCIPCEQMKPVMAKLRKNYKGKIEVIFIDVKRDQNAARLFSVYMIPVQVFLDKNSKEFHRHIGYFPYEEIVSVLEKAGL